MYGIFHWQSIILEEIDERGTLDIQKEVYDFINLYKSI